MIALSIIVLFALLCLPAAASFAPELPEGIIAGDVPDWLVHTVTTPVTLQKDPSCSASPTASLSSCLRLSNGLISRTFALSPDFGTVNLYSHSSRRSLLRSLTPEAYVTLDGVTYPIGGLQLAAPVELGYANRSDWNVTLNPAAWTYRSHTTSAPEAAYPWTPGTRHSPRYIHWPPLGLHLTVQWSPPASAPPQHQTLQLSLHYEMYEGMPLMAQWMTLEPADSDRASSAAVMLDAVQVAALAVNQDFSPIAFSPYPNVPPVINDDVLSRLSVSTDQAHGTSVLWTNDPQVGQTPGAGEPLLNVSYQSGPGVQLSSSPGLMSGFTSFRVFMLVTDSTDRERHGLSVRALTHALAPATNENPIFMHGTDASSDGIRSAVDQMADVGFEMLILSFGTSFNLESTDPTYLQQLKSDIDYAHAKGIEVGGYDLIALTRDVGQAWDAVDPATNATDGNACFASGWFDQLLNVATNFINFTGLSAVETDGPYGGYQCASSNHSHHVGLTDSVYQQTMLQGRFFHSLRSLGVYIHQPDNYFFQGGSKTGLGYNEDQYSLPRWTDLSISRQSLYDDTFLLTNTQGWMFLPLVDYHGGGDDAAFEPLSQHLTEYEFGLAQYLGAGVAACYRGPRLYDTDATRVVVKKWVDFYKAHRDILISDLIHLRRPDMQDIDAFMHVNYRLKDRALAMVFNPTLSPLNRTLTLPLYYTGLTDTAWVQEQEDVSSGAVHQLDRLYGVTVSVSVPPQSVTWLLVKAEQDRPTAAVIG